MRTRRLGALAAAVLLAPVLAGCGSDEPEVEPTILPMPSVTADPAAGFVPLQADGYSIKLPTAAAPFEQTVQTASGPVQVQGYRASDGADGYFAVNLYPNPRSTPLDLSQAVTGAAAVVGGTVTQDEAIRFRRFDGRAGRYTANLGGTELTVFLVALDVRGKILQVQYALPRPDVTERPPVFATVLGTLVVR